MTPLSLVHDPGPFRLDPAFPWGRSPGDGGPFDGSPACAAFAAVRDYALQVFKGRAPFDPLAWAFLVRHGRRVAGAADPADPFRPRLAWALDSAPSRGVGAGARAWALVTPDGSPERRLFTRATGGAA